MRFIILSLFSLSVFAVEGIDPIDSVVHKEIQLKFELREQEHADQFVSCIEAGGHAPQCQDPDWCLYPKNLDLKECDTYRANLGLNK